MMNRRGFLGAVLAAGIAPYVVTSAGVLMPSTKILTLSEAALEGWQSNGGITLDLGDRILLHGEEWEEFIVRSDKTVRSWMCRGPQRTFIARAPTSFGGTLNGQPGDIVGGLFVPAAVDLVRPETWPPNDPWQGPARMQGLSPVEIQAAAFALRVQAAGTHVV